MREREKRATGRRLRTRHVIAVRLTFAFLTLFLIQTPRGDSDSEEERSEERSPRHPRLYEHPSRPGGDDISGLDNTVDRDIARFYLSVDCCTRESRSRGQTAQTALPDSRTRDRNIRGRGFKYKLAERKWRNQWGTSHTPSLRELFYFHNIQTINYSPLRLIRICFIRVQPCYVFAASFHIPSRSFSPL